MVKLAITKLRKVGKVGHAHASHKPLDLDAARSELKVLTSHGKGSAGAKVRQHGGQDLRAGSSPAAIRKPSGR